VARKVDMKHGRRGIRTIEELSNFWVQLS
jgi:hypothetical protein